MRRWIALSVPLLVAAMSLALAGQASAVPRYSAYYQQNCGLCHVNPTGGGQRTLYAAQYIVPGELAMRTLGPEERERIDPMLSTNLAIGFDARTLFQGSDRNLPASENFLQMQGALHLSFVLNERFQAYLSRSLTGTPEVFGLGYVLPYHGYVKVGRFVPAFGWKYADHTLFVRQRALFPPGDGSGLGADPAPNVDVGVELATYPGRLALTVAALNGNLSARGTGPDSNDELAFAGQAIYRLGIRGLGVGIGGSVWRNQEVAGRRTAAGPYGYLSWGRFALLGEAAWSRSRAAGNDQTHLVYSQQIHAVLTRGLEFRGTYDFFDPNTDVATGARYRYGAGLELLPYHFLSIQGMVNFHRFDHGDGVRGDDFVQAYIQTHVFY